MTERPVDTREVPEGYELVAIPDPEWRLVSSKRCRHQGGPRHQVCTEDAVAEFDRNAWRPGQRERWYAYCPAHMYGRWIEDGQVMHWILRKQEDGDA